MAIKKSVIELQHKRLTGRFRLRSGVQLNFDSIYLSFYGSYMLLATLASSLVDTNIVTFSQDVFHARKVVVSTTMYLNNHAILHSTDFKPGGGVPSRLVTAPAVLRLEIFNPNCIGGGGQVCPEDVFGVFIIKFISKTNFMPILRFL